MEKLLFGTAGIPLSTYPYNTINGIKQVRNLGLGAMELEFVRNINISETIAPEVRKTAKKEGIVLTCHAPYYINLNSLDPKKSEESRERILRAARIANLCGCYSLTFHAGFYMNLSKGRVYEIIKEHLKAIERTLLEENNKIWIRPELTGKSKQFGSLKELIRLSEELENILPCIDFSHLYARSLGRYNSYERFREVLETLETIGKDIRKNMHIHVSGIRYGIHGERHHLNLESSNFNFKDLLRALKDFRMKGILISESPNIEEDSLLMKKIYERI
jgi:deoxyribonuclease-4